MAWKVAMCSIIKRSEEEGHTFCSGVGQRIRKCCCRRRTVKVSQAFRCLREYLLFIRPSKPDALGSWLSGIFHGETFPHKTPLLLFTSHKEPHHGFKELWWPSYLSTTALAPQYSLPN